MAQNLIDLRRRIRAVKDTQKTTKAMKTVSAAKLNRSVSELNKTKPMMSKIETLLKRVGDASTTNLGNHPLLKERKHGHNIMVVVSSDKGLCGSFNSNLIEKAEGYYKEKLDRLGEENLSMITLGNKGFKHLDKRNYPITKNYKSMMSRLKHHNAVELALHLQDLFLNPEEEIQRIEFIYTEFQSSARQEVTVKQLFPIKSEWEGKEITEEEDLEYIFEPSAEAIFKALLPKYINSMAYQLLLHSAASEHAARMLAMDLATRNASDMIRSLTLTMNKLRQASITNELLEIITATEALNK